MKISLMFKGADQTSSDFVTGKRSDYSAHAAQNRTDKNELVIRRADARAAQSADKNAGDERHRRCSFRHLGWKDGVSPHF